MGKPHTVRCRIAGDGFPQKRWQRILTLSTGFWAPFMYAHWFIAQTGQNASLYWPFNYLGASTLACVVLIAAVLVLRLPACARIAQALIRADLAVSLVFACISSLAALLVGLNLSRIVGNSGLVLAAVFSSFAILGLQAYWWRHFAHAETIDFVLALCLGTALLGVLKIAMVFLSSLFTFVVAALPFALVLLLPRLSNSTSPRTLPEDALWFTPKVTASLGSIFIAAAVFLVSWSYFNAVLKSTTGHYGFGSTTAPALSIAIQLIDIVLAGTLAWWVAIKKHPIAYVSLWKIAFVCFSLSLLLVAFTGTIQTAQLFSSAAFVVADVLIDLACANIARHSKMSAVCAFAVGELLYNATDWLGRSVVLLYAPQAIDLRVVVFLMFVTVIAIAFLLPTTTLGSRFLLSDLNGCPPKDSGHSSIDECCAAVATSFGLSAREQEIMALLCRGRSKPYIAEALLLSENTVGTYARRLYAKLGIHNKQELLDLVTSADTV